ncbi:ArsO family NAD(P)H-dependent flavin-containing monooxygenase [Pontibacter korlensis]|uniref:Pyridine nucleotide-disulfide oxidoreductase n=1 Tax=Pontibacter korlensis TaxID=400092 RepID=A0A0E3ZE11_9BACT|nr:ArsO family NAD(P)H-dependent flavin-containing monooxygenase [Pontibacter korlensis]AKD02599.1 pyridine nucleotide-disulfide oxidoreductase [Pontibacter korlensis]
MIYDVIVIGGGQSALACAYFLRRADLSYLILDNQKESGGAWLHAWDSLTLFSPSDQSSLPGWLMPKSESAFPTRHEVIDYLRQYEKRYQLSIKRPVQVHQVTPHENSFILETSDGNYQSKALISATGTWHKPYIPPVPGREKFRGLQLHSAFYKIAEQLVGKKVLVVGEGNSGAQIMSEVSLVAEAVWATKKEPEFLPDDVDGRVLFDVATAKYYAQKEGKEFKPEKLSLGNIVVVPTVRAARERNALQAAGRFESVNETGVIWQDGRHEQFDAIIWCTGFWSALDHLAALDIVTENGKIPTEGTKAKDYLGLWLVGYGNWTGFASATLIGVGRSARETVKQIQEYLRERSL